MQMKMNLLATMLLAAVAVGQDIVMLGDSLSDNGSGFAAYVKLVLQTNDVSPLRSSSSCIIHRNKIDVSA